MYGIRNSAADRLGGPARSAMEERLARQGDVQAVHGDGEDNFRYVY